MRLLLAAGLLVAAGAEENTCGSGLTISGSPNVALNADYYATTFSMCGATNFERKSESPSAMRLGSSFISPSCNYTVNQSCYWAVYDYSDQGNLTARVHARCLDCPRPGQGCWPQNPGQPAFSQRWEVATVGGSWEPAPAMRASCCKFKPSKCDNCTNEYCSTTYKTFGSCLKATMDTCCQAGGWIDQGKCLCKDPIENCEHEPGTQ